METTHHRSGSQKLDFHRTHEKFNISPQSFEYRPLNNPAKQIRLVKILPAEKDDPITLEISTWDLHTAPEYYGISYTWGESEVHNILVDGRALSVRQNCYYALWQVRLRASGPSGQYVWIDAICIDQENLQEKGPQVSIMGMIFARSSWIFACIGPHQDGSEAVVKLASAIEYLPTSKAARNKAHSLMALVWNSKPRQQALPYTATADEVTFYNVIGSFAARPYFRRLWIVQEVSALVFNKVTLLCGEDSIPKQNFDDLWLTALDLSKESLSETYSYLMLLLKGQYHDTIGISHGSHTFENLIEKYGNFKCSDPRDRVYGILPLLSNPDLLDVDYEITHVDLAVRIITGFSLESVWQVLRMLNIKGSDADMKRLIRRRRYQNRTLCPSEPAQNLPWERPWSLGRCLVLGHNENGELSAPLQPLLHPYDPLSSTWDYYFNHGFHLGLDPGYRDLKHRVLYSRDPDPAPVGLVCYDAQPGDVVVGLNAFYQQLGQYSEPSLILRHAEGYQYDVIGQCIPFALEPLDQVFETLVELHITAQDIIAFLAQDSMETWAQGSVLRSERVETNPVLSPLRAVHLFRTPNELGEARGEDASNWLPTKHDSDDLKRFVEAAARTRQQ